jgi:phosphoserine phosphatase RsbU/P
MDAAKLPPHPIADATRSGHTPVCSEVWAANSNVAHSVNLPGLLAWVYSAPIELGRNGGDLHYLSVCDNGVLCRVALADVSGHGSAVDAAAGRLLGLMRRHVNRTEQREFLHDVSAAFQRMNGPDEVTYATAVALGFDQRSRRLVFSNAGHPPPLWYRAAEGSWGWLEQSSAASGRALPLGLSFFEGRYVDTVVELGVGDLLVCYTDGLSDATDSAGRPLGAEGLMEMARTLSVASPMAVGATLLGLVDTFRRGDALDDETLIVLQRSREGGGSGF